MNSLKYIIVFAAMAVSMTSGNPFFHHKNVVQIPVHLKPVHLQPVILEKPEIHEIHHIETIPTSPAPSTPAAPTESVHDHLNSVWNSVKNSVGNHKIVRHFFHKEQPAQPEHHVAEFNVWPSLGFSHYKKINYIPVVSTQVPPPSHVEFDYVPQDFASPVFPETYQSEFSKIPTYIEAPKIPKDFESSVSGGQIKEISKPTLVSENSGVKVVPNIPFTSYGVPIQNS